MRELTLNEMRTIDGGASATVNCPICGRRIKVGLISRIFYSNNRIRASLTAEHGLYSMYGTKMSAHNKGKWGK